MSVGMTAPAAAISTIIVDANLDMGAYDLKADDIKESTGAAGVDVDGVKMKDSEVITAGAVNNAALYNKVVSDINRHAHSYDSHRAHDCSVAAKVAGMVFADGLKGTVRVELSISSSNGTAQGNARFEVDGVQKGITKDSNSNVHGNYEATTQDIALDIPAGGELELWTWNDNAFHDVYAKLWKIDYNNAADNIAVAMAEA